MIEILKSESTGKYLVSRIDEDQGWMSSEFFTAEQIEAWRITIRSQVEIVGEKAVLKELGF